MTTTVLTDGRVIHIPGMPFILDSASVIAAPPADELAALVPLVRPDELLPLTKRLVHHTAKRRFQEHYREVNRARLELARLCIERALSAGQDIGSGVWP